MRGEELKPDGFAAETKEKDGGSAQGAGLRPGRSALLMLATNVSRIAGLADGCAKGMELSPEVNRAGVMRILREIGALANELLAPEFASNGEPASGEPTNPNSQESP